MKSLLDHAMSLLSTWTGISRDAIVHIIATLAIVLIYLALRMLLSRLIGRRMVDLSRRYIARKAVGYVLGLAAVVAIINVWFGGVTGMATYLGLLSAGVVLSLSQPLASLAGWFYILVRKPFTVGDRIQVGPHIGDVVDIGMVRFTIVEVGNWVHAEQSTGRIIHIPNNWTFTQALANYTQGFKFIWNEIALTVSYQSNWQSAKELLTAIGQRHSAVHTTRAAEEVRLAADRFLIRFEHLTPIVWTSTTERGVTLTLRYLVEPRQRRSSEAAIWEELLTTLPAHSDIQVAAAGGKLFAPPTQA